jgi:CheY-like chemotaxis protein
MNTSDSDTNIPRNSDILPPLGVTVQQCSQQCVKQCVKQCVNKTNSLLRRSYMNSSLETLETLQEICECKCECKCECECTNNIENIDSIDIADTDDIGNIFYVEGGDIENLIKGLADCTDYTESKKNEVCFCCVKSTDNEKEYRDCVRLCENTRLCENIITSDMMAESGGYYGLIDSDDSGDSTVSIDLVDTDSIDSVISIDSIRSISFDSLNSQDRDISISTDHVVSNRNKCHSQISTIHNIIKRVNGACKNMDIIINDILDLSKLDNNELHINLDEHILREITDTIVDESNTELGKKKLQFIYEYDERCPETICTDGTRVFQILSNLISNAIKYSNTGVIKFRVLYDDASNAIVFQVIDQGRGIRTEEIPNLFKQFGRTSNSVTEINSTGLGLCVCQKIANLIGGTIEVSSEYKKGSTFTFTHPINLEHSGSRIGVHETTNREVKGNILIVDDDTNITALFKLLLRCMNYDRGYELNVETVHTGDNAIQLADLKHYDLIFMDVDLDDADGCVVSSRIINKSLLNKKTPIVAVTADIKSIQDDRDMRYNVFNDIILKPFNNKTIDSIIIKYLYDLPQSNLTISVNK